MGATIHEAASQSGHRGPVSYASACTDQGISPEEMAEALNVAAVIRGGGTIAHWAQTLNTIARKA